MKRILIASLALNLLLGTLSLVYIYKRAQNHSTAIESFKADKRWESKVSLFNVLPKTKNQVIFAGNSITERCELSELFNNTSIKNRGIGGDVTIGLLERIDQIITDEPSKLFIEIGINDLLYKVPISIIISNFDNIISKVIMKSPNTHIYVESVLPVGNNSLVNNDSIIALNTKLKSYCNGMTTTYIDIHTPFYYNKKMNPNLSLDGVHLNGEGYLLYRQILLNFL